MSRRGLLALPPLAGLVAVALATAKGPYVSPDAVFYVGTARNWLDGRGLTPPPGLPPLAHFPPLLTFVLAVLGKLGLDPLVAARVVNALAFAGIVLLVGLVVRARTASLPAALVASVLTLAAVDLLTYSASALSEPLFILLAVSALVALGSYLDRPSPALLAVGSALAAGALLTRYVGIALVLAGIAALVWRRRWAAAAVFGLATLAPLAAWLAWAGGRGPSDRTVALHMFGTAYLGQAARPFARWFVPWPEPPVGLVLALAVVAGGVALLRRVPADPLSWMLSTFTVAYLALLLANRALTDATGRLDARFLAPLHVVAILLVVPALHRRTLPPLAMVVAAALVVAQVIDATAWTAGGMTDVSVARRGYTAAAWRTSPVVARIAANDGTLPLYSNGFDAIAFLTGEPATPIPAVKDYLTGRPNPSYADELATMRAALQSSGGFLAYFDAVPFRRSFLPSRTDLERALPLEVVIRDSLGTLYRLR